MILRMKWLPSELKELKVQLQDTVDKRFIRPSTLSWEVSVMLWMKDWTLMDCRLINDNWVRLSLRTIILDLGWRIYWTNCMVYIYFKINLRTSYSQRKGKEVAIPKIVLKTRNGYYELSYTFWANWYTWNTYGLDEWSNSTLFG